MEILNEQLHQDHEFGRTVNVTKIMNSWTHQPSYPIVRCSLAGNGRIRLSQMPFPLLRSNSSQVNLPCGGSPSPWRMADGQISTKKGHIWECGSRPNVWLWRFFISLRCWTETDQQKTKNRTLGFSSTANSPATVECCTTKPIDDWSPISWCSITPSSRKWLGVSWLTTLSHWPLPDIWTTKWLLNSSSIWLWSTTSSSGLPVYSTLNWSRNGRDTTNRFIICSKVRELTFTIQRS